LFSKEFILIIYKESRHYGGVRRERVGEKATFKHKEIIIDWYNNYNYSIFKYILNMINDYQQEEALKQETFVKVYQYIISDKTISYPKTFNYRTAHNITVDYIRKNAPINIVKDFVFRNKKSREPLIESHVLYNEQYEKLYKEFLTLKRSYRQV